MIDPRRLRVLRALAEHGTVTAAAHALYLSPSAASQQLAALEAEVGHVLLERRGRSVRLAPAGAVLAAHASKIAAQLEEAEADMASCSAGLAGEVAIAAFASAITEVVAPAVAALRDRAPQVRIRVKDAEGRASQRLLIDGAVDIALSVEQWDTPGQNREQLLREPLYGEPFDVVLPSDHPLADALEVGLADLRNDPWITPWPGNPVHDVVMRACEEAGFQPRVECLADDSRAVCALVSAGAGVALVPRSALHGIAIGGAATRPVGGFRPQRRVYTAVRRGSEQHPLLRLVLRELQDRAAALGS
ncbi:molybdate transport repressor ModE-like protein [Streptomyces sp. SAI-135]|uniref:LysR family transcriptional regulator n=1 Tax=unclassified Streptomyces TaxID=2593676 RepID=UPI0024762900|nr:MULTISPECIES: LysR family transcriptional regulator [unclassified Streptomyces]MDH6522943.1 molybdate transport repressor ModE-like protein [Streptomyces sp. SAI-090]MDH6554563.1 molybdate transport repressor ModE-like protein [Streptomyces sp. SAI-041]MDH6573828.1 molybdate transport repressor ModE-like protein [Streptomyces sp. SAI-117]MDH6581439.1 molybdate transport repressor ModE-like protein [Streptomyces sp. SAI-133]MDH6613443.1 molybdate transport repressor ModE-like protein [Strept